MPQTNFTPEQQAQLMTDSINKEIKVAMEWESNWSFMKCEKSQERTREFENLIAGVAQDVQQGDQKPSSSGFSNQAKMRAIMQKSMTPQEKYSKPMSANQEYGWGVTLEVFGPCKDFCITRNPELMADPDVGAADKNDK